MKKALLNLRASFRTLFAALMLNLILMYIVYLMGKSLDTFIPCWIVWILLAVNAIRNPQSAKSCSFKSQSRS